MAEFYAMSHTTSANSSPANPHAADAHAAPVLMIGLMSGTSLDGVDGVLVSFQNGRQPQVLASAELRFPPGVRADFMRLQRSGDDEIHREALAANALARLCADCVAALMQQSGRRAEEIAAIGAHGQTIRHQPGLHDGSGYTWQTLNPALLAELTGIDVIADFRSRDIAAGGQAAPLAPAFHAAAFGHPDEWRVICNIGGIANLTILPPRQADAGEGVFGFDSGPGNVLMDAWIGQHRDATYDADGAWAADGKPDEALVEQLLAEPFFAKAPPKSSGRDLFNLDWLDWHLDDERPLAPEDIQASLCELTARSIADACLKHAPQARTLIACGGGVRNRHLMARIGAYLPGWKVQPSDELGVPAQEVEALAFAWLAWRHLQRLPGNLPAVTGAKSPRVLGALYPR